MALKINSLKQGWELQKAKIVDETQVQASLEVRYLKQDCKFYRKLLITPDIIIIDSIKLT